MNNWIEVSADRLTQNFHAIQTQVGLATTLLAVIKANAYGHGVTTCAPILARAGAQWLGVTCAEEGVRVRRALESAGIAPSQQPEILIMSGFLPHDAPAIHAHALTPVVWTQDQIDWLAPYPGTNVHVEIDTGMGRQGVLPGHALELLLHSLASAGLVADGVFTHFCSSEVADAAITAEQRQRFEAVLPSFQRLSRKPTWIHAANSSAIDNPDRPSWLANLAANLGAKPLVRPGLALYGYTLPLEGAARPRIHDQLKPVLTWKAHILATRALAPGDTVGYNAIFTALRPMRIALLPAGYADGLRRELSAGNQGPGNQGPGNQGPGNHGPGSEKPGGWVLIQGHRAPILGRISMNLTVVDITHIAEICSIQPNDEAILLGDGITAEDHARLAHTIPYEILCGIHPCN